MIEGVFQQAPFDEKLDDEIVKKIAKEYMDFKYISSGHCDKCGRFSAGQHEFPVQKQKTRRPSICR